jgi:hypothetical protein
MHTRIGSVGKIVAAFAAILALLAAAMPAAAAAPPRSLTGETFVCGTAGMCDAPDTLTDESYACNPDSHGLYFDADGSGTFNATFRGVASGPDAGAITETITATIDAHGAVTAFHAAFTVTSPAGVVLVSGTKDLAGGSATGSCNGIGSSGQYGRAGTIAGQVAYRAVVHTAAGDYRDTGSATLSAHADTRGAIGAPSFREQFVSDGLRPTRREQCKGGGWREFGGLFRNQGSCVSFVATGGESPPSGA